MTDKPKKRITFRYGHVAIPPGDAISEDEKRLIWYNTDECKNFKLSAANDAGVRLFDSYESASPSSQESSSNQEQDATKTNPHFVTVGDFDDKNDGDTSVDTDGATCNTPRKCTNEYNDTVSNQGEEVICKRGLGYHFSRHRKMNKAWVRSMLMTWQETVGSMVHEKDPKRDLMTPKLAEQFDAKRHERYTLLLAKVYMKCTRDARKSALWRGRMDYEIAYPNKFDGLSRVASESESKKRAVGSDDEQLKCMKRPTLKL